MAEWITTQEASRISGYGESWINRLIRRGSIPDGQYRRSGFRWQVTIETAERLRQAKIDNSNWTYKEPEQPVDAVHITDPLGVYPGFDLAPDAAQRLMAIRRNKRIYGDTWACNRNVVNALNSIRSYAGDD